MNPICQDLGRKPRAGALSLHLWLLLISGLCAVTTATASETAIESLEQALSAYAAAQAASGRDQRLAAFADSRRLFEQAQARGASSADLYANIGNAALQAEDLGGAILNFRRALAMDPDNQRAKQNLQHARTLLPAWVPRPSAEDTLASFFFWRSLLSPAEQAALAAMAFLVAALLVAVAIRTRSPLARALSLLPALAWIGLLLSAVIDSRAGAEVDAVVIADEVDARASDSRNAAMRFAKPLPGGTEVRILETREHWAHLRLANGRDAWVRLASVEPIESDRD